jgi:hypothetical protein
VSTGTGARLHGHQQGPQQVNSADAAWGGQLSAHRHRQDEPYDARAHRCERDDANVRPVRPRERAQTSILGRGFNLSGARSEGADAKPVAHHHRHPEGPTYGGSDGQVTTAEDGRRPRVKAGGHGSDHLGGVGTTDGRITDGVARPVALRT